MSYHPRWGDAHCHLADARWEASRATLLRRSIAAGIVFWVQGGIEPSDWDRQLVLRREWGEGVVPVFGLHPWWAAKQTRQTILDGLHQLEQKLPHAYAIGELGLDYVRSDGKNESALEAFEGQLDLALRFDKPLVLHVVRAHADVLSILRNKPSFPASGLVHGFSGTIEIARRYLDHGFLLSMGTALLRDGNSTLKKALRYIPQDRIVLETDSPDGVSASLFPNEPANLIKIAEKIAGLYQTHPEEFLDGSARRLEKLLKLNHCNFGHGKHTTN